MKCCAALDWIDGVILISFPSVFREKLYFKHFCRSGFKKHSSLEHPLVWNLFLYHHQFFSLFHFSQINLTKGNSDLIIQQIWEAVDTHGETSLEFMSLNKFKIDYFYKLLQRKANVLLSKCFSYGEYCRCRALTHLTDWLRMQSPIPKTSELREQRKREKSHNCFVIKFNARESKS